MKRDPSCLENNAFDLLVVGGGIYGVFIVWDAAMRGLRVALVERDDFGAGASANSLRIIHSGLRYLGRGQLPLAYRMERELQRWMYIAPHLIKPLPILMPIARTAGLNQITRHFGIGFFNLLRIVAGNTGNGSEKLPKAKIISADECKEIAPIVADISPAGGIIWQDAQIQNSERLTLEVAMAAEQAGATVVNYLEATGLCMDGQQVVGVYARDRITGKSLEITAQVVVNAAGLEINNLLPPSHVRKYLLPFVPSLAFNLVTKQLIPDPAIAFSSNYRFDNGHPVPRLRSRVLLNVPWRGFSLIGTEHLSVKKELTRPAVSESMVADFIAEVNHAFPGISLSLNDVLAVQAGLLPAYDDQNEQVSLLPDSLVIDHQKQHDIGGLISIVGVKYSLARETAEKAVTQIIRNLGKDAVACRTHSTPLPGGRSGVVNDKQFDLTAAQAHGLEPSTARRYFQIYGVETEYLIQYLEECPSWGMPIHDDVSLTYAEVIHGVRAEMALHLEDILLRRTEPGIPTSLNREVLNRIADLMANELGWSRHQRQEEIERAFTAYHHADAGLAGDI